MTKRKLLTLILLGAAVTAILSLAAGLAQVRFPLGEPFTLGSGARFTPPPAGVSIELSPDMRVLLRVWLVLTLALLPFSVFYLLISPAARRRVIRNLIVFGVFVLIMSSVGQQFRLFGENGLLAGLNSLGLTEGGAPGPPAEFSGSAPSWLIIVTSLMLAAIVVAFIAGLIYGLTRTLMRNRRQPEQPVALVRLAEEAESAIMAIEAGGDLRDTVIRCYVEMSRIVRTARGISRQQEMTVREFEEQLERAGLPGDSVHDLTRIFEAVRYGAQDREPGEEARAMACLTAIADACRKGPAIDERRLTHSDP